MRVVIADDELDYRELLTRRLCSILGEVEIDEVTDGEALIERVTADEYAFALTDNDMPPGMSGLDALPRIKDRLPVIMVAGSDVEAQALEAGAVAYISKEIGLAELTDQLRAAIDQYVK